MGGPDPKPTQKIESTMRATLLRAARRLRPFTLAAMLIAAVAAPAAGTRWYTPDQLERGRTLYTENCAACHGAGGEGQPNWQERDSMGFYPAPPLNADGHAWHHPLSQMLKTLDTGGGPNGGMMPSFMDVLDEDEKHAVIAYVQNLWPDATYEEWAAIDAGRSAAPPVSQHDD